MQDTPTLPCNNDQSQSNIINCYGFGCNSKSTRKMEINCGIYRSLTIFVCESCSSKFGIEGKKKLSSEKCNVSGYSNKEGNHRIEGDSEENEKQGEMIRSTNVINSHTSTLKHSEFDHYKECESAAGIESGMRSEYSQTRKST